jgi:DNA-binding SARP family transcriptional activator/WD40 repeat protein
MEDVRGLRFRVLGPVEARLDGSPLGLGGPKQRLVLAALLLHANTVVSIDRLADIVWGDCVPDDAASTLAKYIHRLRSALGPAHASVVGTRPPGYLLSLATDRLDATQFAELARDARPLLASSPGRAKALLDDALGLWRGRAWADFAEMAFVQPEVTRLEGLRVAAWEDRADAMLALSQHAELIPELQAVVAESPLRERPHAQLMLALYCDGRHAEALSVYRAFRSHLRDEVGLEPSASLRALEQDILNNRAELPRPAQVGPVVTPPGPRFDISGSQDKLFGRRRDLDWLEVLFGQATAGDRAAVGILSGPSGVGKTSLVKAFGRLVQARGAVAVFTSCDPVLGAWASLLEAFRRPTTTRRTIQGSDATARAVDDALAALGSAPLLVILDDVDSAADAQSLLEHLASTQFPAPICVVGTARCVDESFGSAAGTVPVRVLNGLSQQDVGELLATVSGAARPVQLVESVWAETAGVPSLVVAMARRLRDVDIAHRVDDALSRAAAARQRFTEVRDEVASGVLAHQAVRPAPDPPGGSPLRDGHVSICPYKGLAQFHVADAAYFCGRDRQIAQLVAGLAVNRFVGIVGASGSGKSSLVAAGLLPALASASLPGSNLWPTRVMRPGGNPVRRLARALATLVNEPESALYLRLDAEPGAIQDIAAEAVASHPGCPSRVVLVVDQFEEVFTSCADDQLRTGFIRALVEGSSSEDTALAIAVVMRADFYGACADYPALARLLSESTVLVGAMTDRELRQAVLEPARVAGLTVEDGVADAICADAAGEPGALPLVSTALLETWVRRIGDRLTLAGYAETGGVRGAVARLAEGVYDRLDDGDKAIVRHIFLRLADPRGVRSDVRRRAPREEVASSEAERQVLAELIKYRLLTATEGSVEVAHEALLREWPRLRAWLEEDREGRHVHYQLTEAAAAWHADGRDEAGLYRGVRLQAARDWAASHPGHANQIEVEFLAASESAHERALRTARRTARRMRSLAFGLAVLLVVALIAGAIAVVQRSETRRQANLARTRALQAETSRLANLARSLPDEQRDIALLLGAEGYRLAPSDETAGGLQAALIQTPPGLDRVIRYPSPAVGSSLDRSGRLLAVAGQDGNVTIYDVPSGEVRNTLTWSRPRQFTAFSGDGSLVAAGGFDGQVAIWSLATGRLSGQPLTVGGGSAWAVFDPTDSTRMFAVTDTGELTTWDRRDAEHPRQIRPPLYFSGGAARGHPSFVTVSRDGQLVAAGDPYPKVPSLFPHDRSTEVWNARSGEHLRTLDGGLGEFAADGVTVPIEHEHVIGMYNAVTGVLEGDVPIPADMGPLPVLSADSTRVAVTEGGEDVAVFDLRSRQVLGPPLHLHGHGAAPLGFLPDGRLLTSGTTSAGIWTLNRTLPPIGVPLPAPSHIDAGSSTIFLPGTGAVLTNGVRGQLLRHDPVTGDNLGPPLAGHIKDSIAGSPDGRWIVAASTVRKADQTAIWDQANGKQLGRLPGVHAGAALAWSPTGRLIATDFGPSVQLWNVSDPRNPTLTANIPNAHGLSRPDYLLFSQDGRHILTAAAEDKRVTIIDVATHRPLWSLVIGDYTLRQVALSPDGKTLAVDSGDPTQGHVTLYDALTGTPRHSLPTQTYGGVNYLHNGAWLVITVGGDKPNAQIYDSSTFEPIGLPFPIPGLVFGTPIAVNTDGSTFSEAESNAPLLWDINPSHWIAIACRIAGRNLTGAEWHQYLPNRPYQRTCPQLAPGR